MRRSPMDHRFRGLMQNLVLGSQPLKPPTKPPQFGKKFDVHGRKLAVGRSTGHDQNTLPHALRPKTCRYRILPHEHRTHHVIHTRTRMPTAAHAKGSFKTVPTSARNLLTEH
jgi:hypothetical protein